MPSQFLYEKISALFELTGEAPKIPEFITNNLPKNFKLRSYQIAALQYFIESYKNSVNNNRQLWNLFHMATGSGKTNLMAAIILFLYEKGYKNFIFVVNSVNIVEKTKENFLNKEFKKYLFAQDIIINKVRVSLCDVENFADNTKDTINIMFTTIQGLHEKLSNPKENSISFLDFEDDKFVIIADEAHHLSASTKNASRLEKQKIEKFEQTWENTIKKIYGMNNKNILLEFTATCDLKNTNIIQKYMGNPADIVYDYPLLKFRNSGYTKELMNLRTNLNPIDRTLQALLLSQYRLKLFEKNKIANSKPIVLLKAYKQITDLDNFYNQFIHFLENDFNETDIQRIRKQSSGIVSKMFEFFINNKITDRILVKEIKQSFSKDHIIKIHSKVNNLDDLQIKLNDLENPHNPYRLIMTLDMLHEGWDVLNLFDIVRLYDERQGGKNSSSKTTIQEAQLIGRGARYFPFSLSSIDDPYKRKFDNQIDNEMRICETLLYHCIDDSKYILEIKTALKETGFNFSEDEYYFEYRLKDSFKNSELYKKGKIFLNEQLPAINENINQIPKDVNVWTQTNLTKHSKIQSLYDFNDKSSDELLTSGSKKTIFNISSLYKTNPNLLNKAIRQFPIFNFDNLVKIFPNLSSTVEFLTSNNYAGRFSFQIETKGDWNIIDIYFGLLDFFNSLSSKISNIKQKFIGTTKFIEVPLSSCITDTIRKRNIPENYIERIQGEGVSQYSSQIDNAYRMNLADKDWFVYNDNFGTTEEKMFVAYFATKVDALKEKYDDIFLIRNERNFSIYSFDEGKRFEPDFLLLLITHGEKIQQHQVFIEPKGSHLILNDAWKEDFLLQLEKKSECVSSYNTNNQFLISGLPFYNHESNLLKFDQEFSKLSNTKIDKK